MENNVNAPENLRVKLSKFKSPLTFNEWVERYNVSSQYVEPTKYFQGNTSAGIKPILPEPTLWEIIQENIVSYFKP